MFEVSSFLLPFSIVLLLDHHLFLGEHNYGMDPNKELANEFHHVVTISDGAPIVDFDRCG